MFLPASKWDGPVVSGTFFYNEIRVRWCRPIPAGAQGAFPCECLEANEAASADGCCGEALSYVSQKSQSFTLEQDRMLWWHDSLK